MVPYIYEGNERVPFAERNTWSFSVMGIQSNIIHFHIILLICEKLGQIHHSEVN